MLAPELSIESEWVLKAVSHKLRRRILNLIYDYTFLNYTDLLREMNLTTGKLNFHLRQLTGLIEKQEEGAYRLTPIGKKALDVLNQVHSISEDKEQTEYFQTIKLGATIKEFKPGKEAKKADYTTVSFLFSVIILIPLIFLASFVDFIFPSILVDSSSVALRKFVNGLILIGIALFVLMIILFVIKKHIESIKYEILDTEIVIHKGILTKSRGIIPYRTITNLLVKRNPFERLFGVSKMIIQTAGESGSSRPEGKIIGIYHPHDLVEEILNLVRLLDPPSYLKEKIPQTITPIMIRELYVKILKQLEVIDKKLSE